jgi:hypothetical protein
MAHKFKTNQTLVSTGFNQPSGQALTLSGNTVIATSGDLRYAIHPTFTGNTQVVDKQYVDSHSGMTGNTFYNLSSPSAIPLGGICAGTTLTGKTSFQLFEELLVPTLQPSISPEYNNSIVLSPASGTICEIGYSIPTLSVTSNFNRGGYSPVYCGGTPYRTGLPNTHTFTGTGVAGSTGTTSLSVIKSTNSYTVLIGCQCWTTNVAFNAGTQSLNSKGTASNISPVGAGSAGVKTACVVGAYPIFATVSSIATPTCAALCDMTNPALNYVQLTLVAEGGGDKQKFEIPCAWIGAPTNNPLTGVRTWVGVASAWCYLNGGTALCSLTEWTPSSTAETVQGNPIGYCRYAFNGVDRSTTCIRLEF